MRKKSSNLSLSEESRKQALQLKDALNRPSMTNLVEALIAEKHKQQFAKSNRKAVAR